MRRIFLLLLLCASLCVYAQKRPVHVAPQSLFGFNPLTNRYTPHNLAPIHTYISQWRAEQPDLPLFVSDSLLDPATKFYLRNIDTTLYQRILAYFSARNTSPQPTPSDSTLYTFPPSHDFLAAFDADIQKIRRFFATPLTTFGSVKTFDPYAPSTLSQYIHHFQIETANAELSLWAPPRLQAQLDTAVYPKDIFYLFRYPNQLVTVSLSGAEVKVLLERIYAKRYHILRSVQSDLLSFNLPPSMHQSIAGVAYRVELTKRTIDAPTLDPKRIYRVAMNSYVASKIAKPTQEIGDYNTLLINYLRDKKSPKNHEQWTLGPERWVNEIKAREKLFFPTK